MQDNCVKYGYILDYAEFAVAKIDENLKDGRSDLAYNNAAQAGSLLILIAEHGAGMTDEQAIRWWRLKDRSARAMTDLWPKQWK